MHRGPRGASVEQLVAAGVELLGSEGVGGVTVRAVAARAGLAFATVQHHFPCKDALLQAVYAAALERDAQRCAEFEALLACAPADADGALQIVRAMLAGACGAAAADTAARNAALLACARRRGPYRCSRRWLARRRNLLSRALRGVTPQPRAAARFLMELLLGLELLTLGCRSHPLLPLLNDELLRYGFDIALGRAQPRYSPWFEHAALDALRRDAAALQPELSAAGRRAGGRRKILEAGARILAERGAAELSHRSVAKEAGVALSVVSYHFRAVNDLVYGVYRFVQSESAAFAVAHRPLPELARSPLVNAAASLRIGAAPAYLASLEAIVAAAHSAELAEFAWKTRMTRGVYYFYRAAEGAIEFGTAAFNVHAYSVWAAGVTLLAEAGWSPRRLEELLFARLERAGGLFPAVPMH